MSFIDYIKTAYKNVLKRKIRFFLSVISIGIGITTVVFITTAGMSGMDSINNELSKMGFNCGVIKPVQGKLRKEEIRSVQNYLNGDYYTSTVVKINGEVITNGKGNECVIYGSDDEILPIFGYNILYGRGLRTNDLIKRKKSVIIDVNLSEKLYGVADSVGNAIKLSVGGIESEYKIIGVTDSSTVKRNVKSIPDFIFMPYTTLDNNKLYDNIKSVYTLPREGDYDSDNINNILKILNKTENINLECTDMNVYKENINQILRIITLILMLIGTVSFVSGGIGVVNTMMITVSERKKEIGIKKALGQNDISVVIELIFEALLTMVISCLTGVGFGLFISKISINSAGISFVPDVTAIVYISAISMSMGILFGFLPAIKTFFMNPLDILK